MCVFFLGGVCVVFVQWQRSSRGCFFGSVIFFLPPWLLCVCVWGTRLPSSTQGFEWQPSRKWVRTVFHSPSAWCGWACVPFPRDDKKNWPTYNLLLPSTWPVWNTCVRCVPPLPWCLVCRVCPAFCVCYVCLVSPREWYHAAPACLCRPVMLRGGKCFRI